MSKYELGLDSITYPLAEKGGWATVEQGQVLKRAYRTGWQRGMGAYLEEQDGDYYVAQSMDASDFPYVRLRPSTTTVASVTQSFSTTTPPYVILGNASYAYVFSGRYGHKIRLSNNVVVETKDFGANSVCGRPVYFEQIWRVPLGITNNAQQLDVIATDPTADTWSSIGVLARHFGLLEDNGVSKLARASGRNVVDLSSDGSTFGDDFEVGDSSNVIKDVLSWQGELAVFKPEGPYLFDSQGNARPLEQFVGPDVDSQTRANAVLGPFLYWANAHSIIRYLGDRRLAVNQGAQEGWRGGLAIDSFVPEVGGARSIAVYGSWIYAAADTQLSYGKIQPDGTIIWYGILFSDSSLDCAITLGGSSNTPILWIIIAGGTVIYRMNLAADGSLKTALGSNRGKASDTYRLWLPTWVPYGGRNVQLRVMRGVLENTGATSPLQCVCVRDNDTATGTDASEDVGATVTADGFFESVWTVGTNDLARRVMAGVEIVTTSGYAPSTSDPRILELEIEAATPTVMRAKVPLNSESLKGRGMSVRDALSNLRNLYQSDSLPIRAPGATDTFTGYVSGLSESHNPDGGVDLELRIERFDHTGAAS